MCDGRTRERDPDSPLFARKNGLGKIPRRSRSARAGTALDTGSRPAQLSARRCGIPHPSQPREPHFWASPFRTSALCTALPGSSAAIAQPRQLARKGANFRMLSCIACASLGLGDRDLVRVCAHEKLHTNENEPVVLDERRTVKVATVDALVGLGRLLLRQRVQGRACGLLVQEEGVAVVSGGDGRAWTCERGRRDDGNVPGPTQGVSASSPYTTCPSFTVRLPLMPCSHGPAIGFTRDGASG